MIIISVQTILVVLLGTLEPKYFVEDYIDIRVNRKMPEHISITSLIRKKPQPVDVSVSHASSRYICAITFAKGTCQYLVQRRKAKWNATLFSFTWSYFLVEQCQPTVFWSFVSRGFVERSNMAGCRLGCVRSAHIKQKIYREKGKKERKHQRKKEKTFPRRNSNQRPL